MSEATAADAGAVATSEELPAETRAALREVLLSLADAKRLLGIRYADWMLGAPTLESGIAASSMAQDEWGHSRLTYALLSDFGDEPKALEHERAAGEYRSPERFDRAFASWAEAIAAGLVFDTAFSVQYHALLESRYAPAHNRVQKMLDEERFHFQHAVGWSRRLAQTPSVRDAFRDALAAMLPDALRWFGRDDDPALLGLAGEGVVRGTPDELRGRFLASIGPVLETVGLADELGVAREGEGWRFAPELDWAGWPDGSRRGGGEGPDADTLNRVRGDRNRAFLMD